MWSRSPSSPHGTPWPPILSIDTDISARRAAAFAAKRWSPISCRPSPPLHDNIVLHIEDMASHLNALSSHQPLRESTKASHAAALFNTRFKLLSSAEDVGRHNALDKAVGKLFLEGTLHDAGIMILSSRISYEMVQKAGRANIPIILAKSRPTALAVSLASELNLTLVCASKEAGVLVFCGEHRLKGLT